MPKEETAVNQESRGEPHHWNILIGCTGSVASVKAPEIAKWHGSEIAGRICKLKFAVTDHSLKFFSEDNLIATGASVWQDKDEWGVWEKMGDPVLHIALRRWADVFVIAPLDANTLAKIASGLCDNLLTCVVRAWDPDKPLLFCPAMNTYMYDNPITSKHISQLEGFGYIQVPCVKKKLACGDTGMGGMASVDTIKKYTSEALLRYLERKGNILERERDDETVFAEMKERKI